MNTSRMVAGVTSVLGLVGLGLTMLPLISIDVSGRLLSLLGDEDFLMYLLFGQDTSLTEYWDRTCDAYDVNCPGSGGAQMDVTGYDVIASGYAAAALIPIVLALGVAVGALYAWRGRDWRVFTFLSLATASALLVLLFTWLHPSVAVSGTGELGQFDTGATTEATGSEATLSVGAGLYLPAAVLTLMFALTTWQAVAASNLARRTRPRLTRVPMAPTFG
ncbi:hypothetical protein [Gordonia liuliyuniae]|uniref:Uncharacterized protein n=1 Tax=Gordonia liuliyuniae TaxID=2911517 RepID=A0ABS9IU10_9ACTN|nr:hypothetical protein [Gordonia liuliyuniae]MCF8588985.1 hypothetical protein [Gordonia liuliyuniae]